eukprot:9201998-Pyramimonas_sp.AAC.1
MPPPGRPNRPFSFRIFEKSPSLRSGAAITTSCCEIQRVVFDQLTRWPIDPIDPIDPLAY